MELFFESVGQYKSSLYEIARNLLCSRNNQRNRVEKLADKNRLQRLQNEQLRKELNVTTRRVQELEQISRQQQEEIKELRQQPIRLPSDLPLPHHTYGPKMISLCLNLNRHIGFRPTKTALNIVFDWLGIQDKLPSFHSMRLWCCRAGVAQLKIPVEGEDWIWIVDHSNQIGREKVLQIIGIRCSDLPAVGETLPLEKMQVLATIPGTEWKREDVRREYEKLAERIGPPRYLLTDGAVELRESADVLERAGEKPILLRDMKHYAANVFEKMISDDGRFKEYLSQLGRTRSAVQQTELSHFTPPPQKPKARFMNLGPTLRWGQMVSYQLSNHRSKARQGITAKRMNEKLGWVKNFRKDLAAWSRCQEVMQASLRFINRQGIYRGCGAELQETLDQLRDASSQPCELSSAMATRLIEFVKESENRIGDGERAWLSTENLESLFGQYKGIERQHSKGGFTSLIAAMPMLLVNWTADQVRDSLGTVSIRQMKQWIHDNLGETLASKRVTAYKEFATNSSG